ncbi:MAG: hypothetical protein DLM70_16845 [Chloroflexi bacterium]|nr:MAG: hypothetical protein DLM70_16845 [Chloroflexota bacterium]
MPRSRAMSSMSSSGYLRQKIDAPFERALIQTVRGVGYTLRAA